MYSDNPKRSQATSCVTHMKFRQVKQKTATNLVMMLAEQL